MLLGNAQGFGFVLIAAVFITSVMLSSVNLRQREFAIRIAMGAKKRIIAGLLLFESTLLGLVGAAIGVLAAILWAAPTCKLISSRLPEGLHLMPHFSLKGILGPLIVCVVCGLLAGVLPVFRARKMDILAILRSSE